MDFDAVADELYGGEPAQFVATRTERAREAKAGGDAALADRIKRLRRPTAAAAAVNRLARAHPDKLRELAELGDRLRRAHTELAGDDLRALTRRRYELVNQLLRTVRGGDAVMREVEATLGAAVNDPVVAADVLTGRLSAPLHSEPGDTWLFAASGREPKLRVVPRPPEEKPRSRPVHARSLERPSAPKSQPRRDEVAEKAKQVAARQAAAARERKARLKAEAADRAKALRRAESEYAAAERRVEKAAATASDLRARLAEAEHAQCQAQKAVSAARVAVIAARTADERARGRLSDES